jgi:hypothetical protein
MVIMVVNGPLAGQVFHLDGDQTVTVGRYGPMPLGDDRISRRHARFVRVNGQWQIEDLASANGTFLNDARLDRPTVVYDGDQLRIGRTTLVVGAVANGHPSAADPQGLIADAALGPPPMPASPVHGPAGLVQEAIAHAAAEDPLSQLALAIDSAADEPTDIARSVKVASSDVPALLPRRAVPSQGEVSVHRVESGGLGAPAMPIDTIPARLVRRWVPALVLAVMVLAIMAQAMLYLRSRESIDEIRSFITQRDSNSQGELLAAVDRQITARSTAERNLLLQEMARLLDQRDQRREDEQELIRQLVLELRSRTELDRQVQAVAATVAPPAEPAPAEALAQTSPVAVTPSVPAVHEHAQQASAKVPGTAAGLSSVQPTLPDPDVVFFVDATGKLSQELPKVRGEIVRELARLSLDDQARVVVLLPEGLAEFPAELLAEMTGQIRWQPALANLPDVSVARHDQTDLATAIMQAIASEPAQLFLMSDTLGSSGSQRQALQEALKDANPGKTTRVHAIQFTARTAREEFKNIARNNAGTYSFVP